MDKLQVIADKLNIRSSPNADPTFANWVGDMNKGETFFATDLVEGGPVDSNNNWHLTNDKNFLSSTGTAIPFQEYVDNRFDGQSITIPIDYSLLLNIDPSL